MNAPAANLVLIGLRASGKSTLGRLVAARLGRPFIDLDDLTAARLGGSSPADALTRRGEPAFRAAEAAALRETLARPGLVVALGGGTPTAPGASELLQQERAARRAVIIYLHVAPEILRSRLAATDLAARPSLTGRGTLDEIGTLYSRRDALYRALADTLIEAGSAPPVALAERIAAIA
jgi:shikimate kinase